MRSWAVLGLLVAFSETPPSGHDRMPTTPLPNQAMVQQARYRVTVLIRSPFTGDRGRGAGHAAPAHPRVRLQRTGRWPLPGTLLAPRRWRCSPFVANGEPRKENPPVSWTRGGLLVVASNGRSAILSREQTFAASVIGGISTSNLFGLTLV
jgi:hypothetical protein